MPRIPGQLPARPRLVGEVAAWSISILAIVTGVLGLRGPAGPALPLALVVLGAAGLAASTTGLGRSTTAIRELRLDARGLGVALAVGVAVGFAQAVPLMLLPIVFQYPLRYGSPWAIAAIAPFGVALLLAGPVSGILIRRFGPRGMMTSGTLFLGVANLTLAAVLAFLAQQVRQLFPVLAGPQESHEPALNAAYYLLFIVPLVLIGAGFVLSTTVRTAIVFASTPRGLPGSAAAINEASVGLGSRVGVIAATTLLTAAALDSARAMVAGRPDGGALVDEFSATLVSLGTPLFQRVYGATLEGTEPIKVAAYSVAYVDGVVAALLMSGAIGIAGALLAWFVTGRRDPLETVFDMQDERAGRDSLPGGVPVGPQAARPGR